LIGAAKEIGERTHSSAALRIAVGFIVILFVGIFIFRGMRLRAEGERMAGIRVFLIPHQSVGPPVRTGDPWYPRRKPINSGKVCVARRRAD
jgi:hypothetical protein